MSKVTVPSFNGITLLKPLFLPLWVHLLCNILFNNVQSMLYPHSTKYKMINCVLFSLSFDLTLCIYSLKDFPKNA